MSLWRLLVFLCSLISYEATTAELERIEFPSVQAAFESLLARRNVKIEVRERWTIITDAKGQIWTFVPLDHPAYPSLMRQRLSRTDDGAVRVRMVALCQAEKMRCEKVMDILRQRNRETAAELKFLELQVEQSAP